MTFMEKTLEVKEKKFGDDFIKSTYQVKYDINAQVNINFFIRFINFQEVNGLSSIFAKLYRMQQEKVI